MLNRDETCDEKWKKYMHTPSGKIAAGIWVVAVGIVLLSKQLGAVYPAWLFTWPAVLIAIGIYISARHLFTNPGGLVLIVIGGLFLVDIVAPDLQLSTFIWPIIIIIVGLAMIFKSNKRKRLINPSEANQFEWQSAKITSYNTGNDVLNTISIFGGVKKNIVSKNFKGGEITCVLGGAEINFAQADIEGKVVLEVTQILGGTKLIIPNNWEVQPEMVAVLGGIEDKRQLLADADSNKILVLRGTSILGGIEIKSF